MIQKQNENVNRKTDFFFFFTKKEPTRNFGTEKYNN